MLLQVAAVHADTQGHEGLNGLMRTSSVVKRRTRGARNRGRLRVVCALQILWPFEESLRPLSQRDTFTTYLYILTKCVRRCVCEGKCGLYFRSSPSETPQVYAAAITVWHGVLSAQMTERSRMQDNVDKRQD